MITLLMLLMPLVGSCVKEGEKGEELSVWLSIMWRPGQHRMTAGIDRFDQGIY